MIGIFKKGNKVLSSDIDSYVVRWNQVYGQYFNEYKKTCQIFTNYEEAKEFEDSLKRAIKLLGHTDSRITYVELEKIHHKGIE